MVEWSNGVEEKLGTQNMGKKRFCEAYNTISEAAGKEIIQPTRTEWMTRADQYKAYGNVQCTKDSYWKTWREVDENHYYAFCCNGNAYQQDYLELLLWIDTLTGLFQYLTASEMRKQFRVRFWQLRLQQWRGVCCSTVSIVPCECRYLQTIIYFQKRAAGKSAGSEIFEWRVCGEL